MQKATKARGAAAKQNMSKFDEKFMDVTSSVRRKPSQIWLVECRLLGHRIREITGTHYVFTYCHDCGMTIHKEDKRQGPEPQGVGPQPGQEQG